jgi:acetyl/propionyl-CoA carboxylase alpha subunit
MRRVDHPAELADALAAARREAAAAFGDSTVYVERMVSPARHVEVQLLGDQHGGLAVLGERDCSVQRRHQKLVEESPSPGVDEPTRDALFESARRVARTVDFHNAATVEFLLDADGNHYFLEMNTHLVAWQIRVAAGETLSPAVLDAPRRGHAIEVRIYAEDPYDGFHPTSGRIGAWRMPEGPGVRVDAGMEQDTDLRPEYDPLLVKLMVHAADRRAAIDRLRRALDETLIGGLQTDAGFLRWLVDDEAFTSGAYDTSLIAERWRAGPALTDDDLAMAAAAASQARQAVAATARAAAPASSGSRWGETARREALR